MKNPKLTKGIAALTVVALLAGGVATANASSFKLEGNGQAKAAFGNFRDHFGKFFAGLSADQRVAIAAKADAKDKGKVKSNFNFSAEQKAELEAKIKARQEAEAKKRAEIKAALEAGDYERWRTAIGTESAIAQKVNSANFAQFVQAYKLRLQSDTILQGLGLKVKTGLHLGLGLGM